MESSQRQRTASATLALLAVAFVAAVMASNTLLSGFRIDLTENRLYTLSPGTEAFLQGLEEPINLYFFFSDDASADIQFLRGYATRVREMLEEFSAVAEGRLNLQVIDPPPFSEEEDRAAQFGLQNINLGTLGDSLYFGLAATNAFGDEAVIEVFDPDGGGFAGIRPGAADIQPCEPREARRRTPERRADERRLRSPDPAADAAVVHEPAGAATFRRAQPPPRALRP